MGADLQCERSPCSVCAFTGECCSPPCITLVGLPQKPQTSIAGEKTTKSSSLSLCDSLGLLPKQIGLAHRSPLHHLSSGWMRKGGSGQCSRLEVYIQTDMSRFVKWQGAYEEPPKEFCSFMLLRRNTLCNTTFGTHLFIISTHVSPSASCGTWRCSSTFDSTPHLMCFKSPAVVHVTPLKVFAITKLRCG